MLQNFELLSKRLKEHFLSLPNKCFSSNIRLSWSNWCFGIESPEAAFNRLRACGLEYIELHGNHYGRDLGYRANEIRSLLSIHSMKVSGICGMFSPDRDLSSNNPIHRQNAIDYIRRSLDFASEVGAEYMLVVPGAVGRPNKYDDSELERSTESLRIVASDFASHGVKAAVEPIRSAEVSIVHTVAEAKRYIELVNCPSVSYINGDVYHMQAEETSISNAIIEAGEMLVNLHLADSNRRALGDGSIDLDSIIRALYCVGSNGSLPFTTLEPLGPGGDPYPAMHSKLAEDEKLVLVKKSVEYFRTREVEVLSEAGH